MVRKKRKRPIARRKSAKKAAAGRKLAKRLPRDRKGKFLPAGSKNLFRRKKARKRSRSAPPRTRRRKQPVKRARLTRRKSHTNMSRGKSVTTDVFPNFMSGTLTLSGPNDFTTVRVNTPIPRLKTIGNRATVMELLWMEMVVSKEDFVDRPDRVEFQMSIGTPPTQISNFGDPLVFATMKYSLGGLNTGLAALITTQWPWITDFQSQDGHGYLLASDAFNVSGDSLGQDANAIVFGWKLFYRFVSIPLTEFIGIVQSTQQI